MSTSELIALVQVIGIDLLFAADNAIVVALAAAGLPLEQRKKAIIFGIAAAAIMRIFFTGMIMTLLKYPIVLVIGGVLLLWVAWKLFSEIRSGGFGMPDEDAKVDAGEKGEKTLLQASIQIIIADISMSLDNILAVAGVARHHFWVMMFGLGLSVVLMGVAATMIARYINRYPIISWIGLIFILYVAVKMIWDGIQPWLA